MNREDLIAATRAYLADWEDDGHTIIEWRDLLKYGFDPVWLRDQVRDLKSGVGKWQIYDVGSGKPIEGMEGIHTLALLEEICRDLGLRRRCVVRRRNRSGEIIDWPVMGRGTCAHILTRRIRVAIGDAEPPKDELHPD